MDEGTRHAVISADDHGPILAMTTWFLICTLIICTATRLGVRFATRSPRTVDDLLILAAATVAIGGAVAGSFAVESGFGKRISLLTPAALEKIQKELYTATVLYILTIGLSKLSITTFLERLACTSNHKISVIILYTVSISWTFAFTTGVLFQCELPRPWAVLNGKCIPMLPFWIAACLVDVLTDVGMIILPIRIVSSLQLPSRKKTAVISTFSLRTLLILLGITRVILLDRAIHGDWSFDSIPYAITTQAYSTVSVIVACLPGLKPFIDSVRTGMLSASLARRERLRPHNRPSVPTVCPAEASIFVFENQGRVKPRPKPVTPLRPLLYIPAPAQQLSSGSRRETPPRPPPPPEALRPDLTCFQPRLLGQNSTVVSCERKKKKKDKHRVKRRGMITKTRQWEVKVEGVSI
ncbi:hypothetical protein P171DRAFT_516380 [Karstenula rhodostoma CBS 690.94]|uniref:Rhodopsin domain-containing protein n=1 Tax=Karstenula rhodostoma CBS 690.94 TaxID=1392251 RepID=A0A9P4PSG8_9PLEO|nr:hypothetical protein P171DRAFT_516380 [Karstenula rhodostoma CBS 690.94]